MQSDQNIFAVLARLGDDEVKFIMSWPLSFCFILWSYKTLKQLLLNSNFFCKLNQWIEQIRTIFCFVSIKEIRFVTWIYFKWVTWTKHVSCMISFSPIWSHLNFLAVIPNLLTHILNESWHWAPFKWVFPDFYSSSWGVKMSIKLFTHQ